MAVFQISIYSTNLLIYTYMFQYSYISSIVILIIFSYGNMYIIIILYLYITVKWFRDRDDLCRFENEKERYFFSSFPLLRATDWARTWCRLASDLPVSFFTSSQDGIFLNGCRYISQQILRFTELRLLCVYFIWKSWGLELTLGWPLTFILFYFSFSYPHLHPLAASSPIWSVAKYSSNSKYH